MKKQILLTGFLAFSVTVFAEQKLENTRLHSGGNFVTVDVWNEIKKSDLTYEDFKKMQKTVNDLSNELQKESRSIQEQQKTINEMKREIDRLENTVKQQNREIDDLKRKIK